MNKYKIKTPFYALAPMANITTYPFASQAARFGADLVWTPMVHTDTIINNWPEAEKILNFKEIPNFLVQIVGSDPEKFASSVKIIEKNLKPLGIDLNMACPDKNIVKSGCGGSLMQKPEQMFAIVKAVKEATNLPVSVKTRVGFKNNDEIFELAPKMKELGIDMITIHGRTVKQAFTGEASWKEVSLVKEMMGNVLVCGSGDITTWEQAIKIQQKTGVDGVMIGRGALGTPWIFKEIKEQKDYESELPEIKKLALEVAEKSHDIWGEKGITESKKHFAWYFRGFLGASKYRKELMAANTLKDVQDILKA
jgi:nifR3 family TIM-barrel protein